MKNIQIKYRLVTSFALLFVIFSSCNDDSSVNNVPSNSVKLTADNLPKDGDYFSIHTFNKSTRIDPGPSGEGVTWTFDTFKDQTTAFDLAVNKASSSEWSSNFPEADIVITNNYYGSRGLSPEDDNFHFYSLKNGQLIKQGRVDKISNSVTLINKFDDPEIQYNYPLEIGSTNTDKFNGGFTSINDVEFTWSDGETSYTVDGTGTLKMQGLTINNVFRVKRTRKYLSNSSLTGENNWFRSSYEWYVPGISFPILSIQHVTVNGQGDAHSVYFMDEIYLKDL